MIDPDGFDKMIDAELIEMKIGLGIVVFLALLGCWKFAELIVLALGFFK